MKGGRKNEKKQAENKKKSWKFKIGKYERFLKVQWRIWKVKLRKFPREERENREVKRREKRI